MEIYSWLTVLLIVVLALTSVLAILLVLIQNRGQSFGLLGGGSQSAFGSGEGDVLTRVTGWVIMVFMLGSLSTAWLIAAGSAEESAQIEAKEAPISPQDRMRNDGSEKLKRQADPQQATGSKSSSDSDPDPQQATGSQSSSDSKPDMRQ